MFDCEIYMAAPPLRKYFHSYHFLSGQNLVQQKLSCMNKIFLVINYGDSVYTKSQGESDFEYKPGLYVSGVFIKPRILHTNIYSLRYVSILMNPVYSCSIFRENFFGLTDSSVNMENFTDFDQISWLPEMLSGASNNLERAQLLDSALGHYIRKKNIRENPIVDEIQHIIKSCKGNIEVSHLSDQIGYSERSTRRKVLEAIGISPSQYCKIFRAHHSISRILFNPDIPILDLVYESGYFDQSHFINDIKRAVSMTPQELRDQVNSPELHTLKNTFHIPLSRIFRF